MNEGQDFAHYKSRITGLCRVATRVLMYNTARTEARPPPCGSSALFMAAVAI